MDVVVTGTLTAVPGVPEAAALLVDLPSLGTELFGDLGILRDPQEWWLATRPAEHHATASAAAGIDGLRVTDRAEVADQSGSDPYWRGARAGLLAAALGAILLGVVGLTVDVWATARRRVTELAVLHTLGATPRLMARVAPRRTDIPRRHRRAGRVGIGTAVGATMAPLVILTPAAGRPVPAPLLSITWVPIA